MRIQNVLNLLEYKIDGSIISFKAAEVVNMSFSFELGVTVSGANNTIVSTSRCIEVKSPVLTSTTLKSAFVSFPTYQKAFVQAFGSLQIT